ncbi:DUF2764 family protein [Amaricoccus sp.]|uniref:DUF2764 family protein n=1 Tax=Amaricoccus sp. TaxID=1872485 RepID=UPI001B5EC87B|nr:DUF2764 family protein [Amaricoccus sp.]MBP7002146.1 DUF2764 family protein [Amaricoccus sp.]
MIYQGDPYVTLMASLPAIGLLSEKEPPINRARLNERLKALSPEDMAGVELARSILSWDRIDVGDDDAAFLDRAAKVLAGVPDGDLRAAIEERLEIRTLVAALRRRHAGEEAPPPGAPWGFGRHVERIRAGWSLPDFGLGRSFPWLPAARDMLEKGDAAGMERVVLEAAWEAAERRAFGHEFDLEAVGLYLMRWSLAERWARYDSDAAAARFAEMLDAAMAGDPGLEDAA